MKAGQPAEAIHVPQTREAGGRERLTDRADQARPANQLSRSYSACVALGAWSCCGGRMVISGTMSGGKPHEPT